MSKRVAWVLVGTGLLGAPGLARALTTRGESAIKITAGGSSSEVSVTPSRLTSPELQLGRSPGALRGFAYTGSVDLSWKDDRVEGLAQGQPVELYVTATPTGVQMQGLYAGRQTHLRVSNSAIDGAIGGCSYSLAAAGGVYSGQRTCNGEAPRPLSVTLPALLDGLAPAEQVALLAVVLSH